MATLAPSTTGPRFQMTATDDYRKRTTQDLIARQPILFWSLRFVAILGIAGFFMMAGPGTKACCAIPVVCPVGSGSWLALIFGGTGIAAHWIQKLQFRISIWAASPDFAVLLPGVLLYFALRQAHLALAC